MLTRSKGNYLLEFGAVLAALLPIFLGAIDITSALQGYNAVHASTATAARCVFPTDGACIQAASFTPSDRLFDWYRGERVTRYAVPFARYSGTGYWLRGNAFTWNRYIGKVYTTVSYDVTQQNYQSFNETLHREQPLLVMTEAATLPRINGNDPRHPSTFSYRATEQGGPKPFAGALAASIRRAEVTRNQDGIIEITPPSWASDERFGKVLCRKAKLIDTGILDSDPDFNTPCETIDSGKNAKYPIAFWIGGHSSGGIQGTASGVAISMVFTLPDGETRAAAMELGGQVFSDPGAGRSSQENFDPRGFQEAGVTTKAYEKISGPRNAEAPRWASDLIKVPANATKITLRLKHSATFPDSLAYRIDEIRAFAPIISTTSFLAACSAIPCGSSPVGCELEYAGQKFGGQIGGIPYSTALDHSGQSADAAIAVGPEKQEQRKVPRGSALPFPSIEAARAALVENGECPATVEVVGPTAGGSVSNEPCPRDASLGTLPLTRAGCTPRFAATAKKIKYSTAFIEVPQNSAEKAAFSWDYQWRKESCADAYSESQFAPPAGLQRYEEFEPASFSHGPAPEVKSFDLSQTKGSDPRPLQKTGGAYSCSGFELAQMRFDGVAGSLFDGDHLKYQPTPQCLNRHLLEEALRFGLSPFAYFEADPAQPPHGALFGTVDALEDSSCVEASPITTIVNPQRIAENLPEGTAPSECPSEDCYSTFAGTAADSGSSIAFDLQRAKRWGEEELKSSYPRARFDCKGSSTDRDCSAVEARIEGGAVTVTSSVNVPFYFLGKSVYKISHTASRKLEREYAR